MVLTFTTLPTEIQEKVLLYLKYDEISTCRQVSSTFNTICQQILNHGFAYVERLHQQISKEIKAKLPRRESERRNHPLSRQVDILAAIETRLSLLGMTYAKYMESKVTCFIPGKVLDEVLSVLRFVRVTKCPPRAHEVLQELRDISSMAMEHFDERIAPTLRSLMKPGPSLQENVDDCLMSLGVPSLPSRYTMLRSEVTSLKKENSTQAAQVSNLKKELAEVRAGMATQSHRLAQQELRTSTLERLLHEKTLALTDLSQRVQALEGNTNAASASDYKPPAVATNPDSPEHFFNSASFRRTVQLLKQFERLFPDSMASADSPHRFGANVSDDGKDEKGGVKMDGGDQVSAGVGKKGVGKASKRSAIRSGNRSEGAAKRSRTDAD